MRERLALESEIDQLKAQTDAAYVEHEVAVSTLRKSRDSQMMLDRAVKSLQEKANMLEAAQSHAAVVKEDNRQLERALHATESIMAASVDTFARLNGLMDARSSQVQLARAEAAARQSSMTEQLLTMHKSAARHDEILAAREAEIESLKLDKQKMDAEQRTSRQELARQADVIEELEQHKRSCESEVESYKRLLHAQGAQQLEVSDSARKQTLEITQLYQVKWRRDSRVNFK